VGTSTKAAASPATVNGHSARPTRTDPAAAARLRRAGYQWDEVARQAGYATGRVAQMAVRAFHEKAALEVDAETRAESLRLVVERFEELLTFVRPSAEAGDLRAVAVAMKLNIELSKLLRLYSDDPADDMPPMIILSGTPEERVAIIKRLVEQRRAIAPGFDPSNHEAADANPTPLHTPESEIEPSPRSQVARGETGSPQSHKRPPTEQASAVAAPRAEASAVVGDISEGRASAPIDLVVWAVD
jgi:hypothetical protein